MLLIVPVTLARANEYIRLHHRHNGVVAGCLFACGVELETVLVGVGVVGWPVARLLNDGRAAEIRRVCTDGTPNACSMLYGALRRAGRALGYGPIYTYTLPGEGGASLRGAGFVLDAAAAGAPSRKWNNRFGRNAKPIDDDLFGGKWRWIA